MTMKTAGRKVERDAMRIDFIAKITNIHHDYLTKVSTIYFNRGSDEVILRRPMKRKYEWHRRKGQLIAKNTLCRITVEPI